MKKIILAGLFLLAFSVLAQTQRMSNNTLGLRFCENSASDGFELSYQHKLNKVNRLEVDFGWGDLDNDNYDSFKLTGLYQWVWKIDGGLNWYLGVGAGMSNYSYDIYQEGYYLDSESGVFIILDGDLGIEYNFEIPLQIALDLRPEYYFEDRNYYENFRPEVGLGFRYRF